MALTVAKPTGVRVFDADGKPATHHHRAVARRQAATLAELNVADAAERLVLDWTLPLRHATFYKAIRRRPRRSDERARRDGDAESEGEQCDSTTRLARFERRLQVALDVDHRWPFNRRAVIVERRPVDDGIAGAAMPTGVSAAAVSERHATCPTRIWFGPRRCPLGHRVGASVTHLPLQRCGLTRG
jgi:hypothetical protein